VPSSVCHRPDGTRHSPGTSRRRRLLPTGQRISSAICARGAGLRRLREGVQRRRIPWRSRLGAQAAGPATARRAAPVTGPSCRPSMAHSGECRRDGSWGRWPGGRSPAATPRHRRSEADTIPATTWRTSRVPGSNCHREPVASGPGESEQRAGPDPLVERQAGQPEPCGGAGRAPGPEALPDGARRPPALHVDECDPSTRNRQRLNPDSHFV
jgi:hypothetical protein